MLSADQCWKAVKNRDRDQDGHFLFGVKTTGIFCRPSCAARRPLRKNVLFFRSADDAASAGLRPCLRCHPLDEGGGDRVARISALCLFIRQHCTSGDSLALDVLAERAGISQPRLRREFFEVVGVTPREYVEACRFEVLKAGLDNGERVTRAIYDAGFGSSSRVYENVDSRLGMTPGEYRSGGRGLPISYLTTATAIGYILMAATDRGICSVQLGDSIHTLVGALRDQFPGAEIEPASDTGSDQLEAWAYAVRDHVEGHQPRPDLPLDVRGTAFQQRVWRFLQTIPSAETRSYAEVATAIGQPRAVRAVASACAANRAAVLIPCHRVIRSDGSLGGFRWGTERKKALLDRERMT